MGHARAYLTFDILRRIMEDYFNYSVLYQMNITDIDDKIIKRARVNELLANWEAALLQQKEAGEGALLTFTESAVAHASRLLQEREKELSVPLPDEAAGTRAKAEREEKLMELELKKSQLEETKQKIEAAKSAPNRFEALFLAASGVNGELLDVQEGAKVSDQSIFDRHARFYEKAFFDDMRRLGVRDPDVVSRVTEYVPQVVTFVETLMKNGFAYKGETSIFFDTEAYIAAGHDYPKLKPTNQDKKAVTTADEMQEGEGTLSKAKEGEKKSPNDFALWKFSKPGEPVYPSPFGAGRPGWHIECSVMATDILGENMDIHSGGWDLKFPHHDNEIAQTEACNLQHQWVNYFLHCGHLHIKGLKMSKSLKNFITIRQALDELGVSPRTMRLLFLANPWHKAMNFGDQSLDEAKERERVLRSFFGSVEAILRKDIWQWSQGVTDLDRELIQQWKQTEEAVHAALCNNFDTPTALTALMDLVSFLNRYLSQTDVNSPTQRPSATLLQKTARYITRMFQIFGVVEGTDAIGFDPSSGGSGGGAAEADAFNTVVDTLVEFRDAVRQTAKETNTTASFIGLCDAVRDDKLIEAGVRLEDVPGGGATVWKRDEPALLRKEKEEREALLRSNNKKKLENQIATRIKLIEKWEQYTADPKQYFIRQKEALLREGKECKYVEFDKETGYPSKWTDNDGATVAAGDKDVKKFAKEVSKYEKLFNDLEAKGGVKWLEEQKVELSQMQEELSKL